MKLYNDLVQGSPEWLAVRLGKFGGTDAQAVATNGKGLETLCFQKVGEIITNRPSTTYTNPDMERGNELEDTARSAYEIQAGNQVVQIGYVELSEYVGVSPDGLIGDDGLVEIKCPTDANFVRFMIEKKPDTKYVWQMQHQMYVTDRKWCDFVVFNDNLNKMEVLRVDRDESMIEKLRIGLEQGVAKVQEILERTR